jgi:hypothetical protein
VSAAAPRTLGEMRETGARRLIVFCADYKCSHNIRSRLLRSISGPTMFGFPSLNHGSSARFAESAARISDRISSPPGGRQKHWIKVKNRTHPAMDREL